jgi:hypothetical protein
MSVPFFSKILGRFFLRSSATDGSGGLLGAKFETAWPKSALCTWFQFEQVGEPTRDGIYFLTEFKPSGPAFRSLVTLRVRIDQDGLVRALRLSLARSFISDRAQGIFAFDLAKSFLRTAAPRPDEGLTLPLAEEIESRAATSRPLIVAGKNPAAERPSGPGSDAYCLFIGHASATWQKDVGHTRLRLQEETVDSRQWLNIDVERI